MKQVGMHPHTVAVLPFVVEYAGGINKGRMQFGRMCREAAGNMHVRGSFDVAIVPSIQLVRSCRP